MRLEQLEQQLVGRLRHGVVTGLVPPHVADRHTRSAQPRHQGVELARLDAEVVDRAGARVPGRLRIEVQATLAQAQEDVAGAGELCVHHDHGAEVIAPVRNRALQVGCEQVDVMQAQHAAILPFSM